MEIAAQMQSAIALHRAGRLAEAESIYRRVLAADPQHPDANHLLGLALHQSGKSSEALPLVLRSVQLAPALASYRSNLGSILQRLGRVAEAEAAYRQALRLEPALLDGWMNLGSLLRAQGRLTDAEQAYLRARSLAPDTAEVHHGLGTTLKDQMRPAEAIAAYRAALKLNPAHAAAFSNLLLNLHFCPDLDAETIFREHVEYGRRFAPPSLQSPQPHRNSRDPHRRLRIGYVSADFHAHPVAFFMLPALMQRDRAVFEVFCYADVRRRDPVGELIPRIVDRWCEITGMGDEQAAQLIREHQIDILVDLGGHSGDNRLGLFARKPAPVQVSYLGYPDTTGVAAIDYRITDAVADPPGPSDELHVERLLRLDGCFLCYAPPPGDFAPNPKSARQAPVVFGSFNRLAKVTEPMIACWSRILRDAPQTTMLMKAPSLSEPPIAQRLRSCFRAHGIGDERVELMGHVPGLMDHLRAYDRISIALDTFPYNGTTTTCEALWMGVPVITLAGQTHVSRVGASLLSAAGATEWIARDPMEYERIALDLARDPENLAAVKRSLRDRLLQSRLGDVRSFTRELERTYREIWQQWCQGH